jgi:hypothetical protein
MSRRKYQFILNEIGMCAGTSRVDGSALLDFMFHTDGVTEEVAEKSESLLTKLMQDDREWIWVEVDSREDPHVVEKKRIGAMGYAPEDPFDRLTVKLKNIHKRWRNNQDEGLHPLAAIVEAWVASGKNQEQNENREAARQGTQA